MWTPRGFRSPNSSSYSKRSSAFIDREFQLRYTKHLLLMASVSTIILLAPAFFLATQNYQIFISLADSMKPQLANQLSREFIGLNIAFFVLVVTNGFFWWLFGQKMTANIVGPAKILRNHIRIASRGDFSVDVVKLRDTDEFKDLVQAYNYLYTLLKVQTNRELSDLKKVKAVTKNPIALQILDQLIEEKSLRLKTYSGDGPEKISPAPSSGDAASRDSLRVS